MFKFTDCVCVKVSEPPAKQIVELSQLCNYMQLLSITKIMILLCNLKFLGKVFATTTRTWPDVFAVEKATMDLANSMLNMAEDMERVILDCQASVSFDLVWSSCPWCSDLAWLDYAHRGNLDEFRVQPENILPWTKHILCFEISSPQEKKPRRHPCSTSTFLSCSCKETASQQRGTSWSW